MAIETESTNLKEAEGLKFESRFGDKEKIVEAMMTGEIVEIGSIEEIYPNIPIPDHMNVVNIADVAHQNANQILGIKIQKGEDILRCVFKPADGESQESKEKATLESDFKFYPRECAAYLISEHFDLDIVPPTVIREIDGRIGAVQLFLSPEYYQNFSQLEDAQRSRSYQGEDWQKIAVLDWVLVNCERHEHNMLAAKENPQKLAAIDHGIILSVANYFGMALRGPSLQLTAEAKTEKPKSVQAPEELLAKIRKGIENRDQLDAKLTKLEDGDKTEKEAMWKRAQAFVDYKVFLSKENYKAVTGRSWMSDYY